MSYSGAYGQNQYEAGTAEKKIAWSEKKKNAVVTLDDHFAEMSWDQLERSIDGGVYDRQARVELRAEVQEFRRWRWRPADVMKNPRIRKFRSDMRASILQSLQGIDHLSAVGAHHVENPLSKDGRGWKPWYGQRLVANLGRAAFCTIIGPPQVGKTNTGLILAENFAAKDPQRNVVISNIQVSKPPDWYRHVDTLSGLFRTIVGRGPRTFPDPASGAILNNPRWDPGLADMRMRWLWVFDEAGVVWKKKKATANVSVLLETVAKHLGKNDGNIGFIEQTEAGIPTIIEGFTQNRYRAIAPGVVQIQQGNREDFRTEWWYETVRNFPKSSLKYDPDDRAPFLVDLDVDAMNESLVGSTNQVVGIRRYLDRMETRAAYAAPTAAPQPPINLEGVMALREARVPWAQIAESMNVPVETLRSRLQRARAKGETRRPAALD